ncbi:hypothetical protein Pmani_013075 [Petrolisthes manimaculis]|uniref:Uncharacterized protein n=1 Tax=Petrolisthes manimaculis TaxID=1843537 RepID=A0AAE1PWP3_9EUCA|nr:hypothetical protein Pmani_013075 [Petrolisthes manimaculis]
MHLSFLPAPPATMNTVLLVLASVVTVSLAAPQLFGRGRVGGEESTAAILLDDRSDDHDGNFNYEYVTENGIVVTVAGRRGSRGQSNMLGSYRFPFPDGTFAVVNYVADEAGYRAQSPLLPTPHPLPPHALLQVRFAEEQRARGIQF